MKEIPMGFYVKPLIAFLAILLFLFVCGVMARADDFLDHVKALEAKNAMKTSTPRPLMDRISPPADRQGRYQFPADKAGYTWTFDKATNRWSTGSPSWGGSPNHLIWQAADPFSPANAKGGFTTPYCGDNLGKICDCGCIQTGACTCKNCNSPVKTKELPSPIAAPVPKTVSPGHVVWNPVTRQWDWVPDANGPKIGDTDGEYTFRWSDDYGEYNWYKRKAPTKSGCSGSCPAGCDCPGTAGGVCTCHSAAAPSVPQYVAPRFFVGGGSRAASC